MICSTNATKYFDSLCAVDHVSAEIQTGSVFGLIGSNGAGKSTFLRMLSGILKPDEGSITIDDEEVFENVPLKNRCFYISDEQFFFSGITPLELQKHYSLYYPLFDKERYKKLMNAFELDEKRKVRTFSKGMKKQVSVIMGLCSGAEYLFCDETFDGLDPVARQAVKSLFAEDIAERGITPIIASHNLRELEDICDHIGLLHRGGILFSRDLDDMKLGIHKVQVIWNKPFPESSLSALNIMHKDRRGSLYTLTVRGTRDEVQNIISNTQPTFFELLPLSLEEIFISETEVIGYDIKSLLL